MLIFASEFSQAKNYDYTESESGRDNTCLRTLYERVWLKRVHKLSTFNTTGNAHGEFSLPVNFVFQHQYQWYTWRVSAIRKLPSSFQFVAVFRRWILLVFPTQKRRLRVILRNAFSYLHSKLLGPGESDALTWLHPINDVLNICSKMNTR